MLRAVRVRQEIILINPFSLNGTFLQSQKISGHCSVFGSFQGDLDITLLIIGVRIHEMCPNMEFFLVRIFPHSD